VLDRITLKRTIARTAVMTAVSLLAALSLSAASGANVPRPTVSAFTASADSPSDVATASPLVLYNSGGSITLAADISNARSCVFSSNQPIVGMPMTVPCADGPVTAASVAVPANSGSANAKYVFHLIVRGHGTPRSTRLTVVVSTQPMPPPVPDCIEIGSVWDFSIPELPALSFQETFDSGSTFTSNSDQDVFRGGTYAVVDGIVTETFAEGGQVTATWNGSEYFGLIDLPYLGESGFAVEPTASLPAGC
jgi:hypothetical protein